MSKTRTALLAIAAGALALIVAICHTHTRERRIPGIIIRDLDPSETRQTNNAIPADRLVNLNRVGGMISSALKIDPPAGYLAHGAFRDTSGSPSPFRSHSRQLDHNRYIFYNDEGQETREVLFEHGVWKVSLDNIEGNISFSYPQSKGEYIKDGFTGNAGWAIFDKYGNPVTHTTFPGGYHRYYFSFLDQGSLAVSAGYSGLAFLHNNGVVTRTDTSPVGSFAATPNQSHVVLTVSEEKEARILVVDSSTTEERILEKSSKDERYLPINATPGGKFIFLVQSDDQDERKHFRVFNDKGHIEFEHEVGYVGSYNTSFSSGGESRIILASPTAGLAWCYDTSSKKLAWTFSLGSKEKVKYIDPKMLNMWYSATGAYFSFKTKEGKYYLLGRAGNNTLDEISESIKGQILNIQGSRDRKHLGFEFEDGTVYYDLQMPD